MTRALFAGPIPAATTSLGLAAAGAGLVTFTCELEDVAASVRIDAVDVVILNPQAAGAFLAAKALRRAKLDVAVVFVANDEPVVDDVVTWLAVADHCLIGVLEPREILAHVAAVERRRQRWASSRIEIGGVAVDTMLRIAELDGRPLPLTGSEYAVLEFLMTRAGRCVTKEMILDHCYGGMDEPEQKIVDVFVCKLRKKLRDAGGPQDFIETVWGRGYLVRRTASARALAA